MYRILLKIILVFTLSGCATLKHQEPVFRSKKGKSAFLNAYNQSLKLWGVNYTEEDIPTSLGIAHVITAGPANGKAIVLLHGMDATSTMWFPNIKALSKKHRVYAIDFLKEVGKSRPNEKSLSKDEIADWYNQIFSHYKLNNYTLIGASKGGWLATLLATQPNCKAEKLILLSPAQTFQTIENAGKATAALWLKAFPSRKKLDKTLEAFSYYPEKINTVYKTQFFLANRYAKKSSGFLQMQPFSADDLKKIQAEVLILIGDHDIINSEESFINAKKSLPNSKTEIVAKAGHFLSIDQSEKVNKLMVDFLK